MRRTWRVGVIGRLFGLGFAAVGIIVLQALIRFTVDHGVTMNLFWGLLTGLGFTVVPLAMTFRPSVTLTEIELVVRNEITTERIDLCEIKDIEAGYNGLGIITQGDDFILAWAVQKSNVARWFRLRTRADRVAEAICAQARVARQERNKHSKPAANRKKSKRPRKQRQQPR